MTATYTEADYSERSQSQKGKANVYDFAKIVID